MKNQNADRNLHNQCRFLPRVVMNDVLIFKCFCHKYWCLCHWFDWLQNSFVHVFEAIFPRSTPRTYLCTSFFMFQKAAFHKLIL